MRRRMRVLVACEFSGIVRDAFAARGHHAYSCDTEPGETVGRHYEGDVRDILRYGWDLMIAHPPCTYLAVSGARWFPERMPEQKAALAFVRLLMFAPIAKIAIENPVSVISTQIRKPDQVIQPWQFGVAESKKTCLWLKGLPLLEPTCLMDAPRAAIYMEPGAKNQSKNRSRTCEGIAEAMAEQWG